MVFNTSNLLGENSYPAIVNEIYKKFQDIKCQTMTGDEVCKNAYLRLNESITPMLELKEFTTKAEAIAGDDVTIKELIDFIRKKVQIGDLNFIINLCKEEHFQEMSRLNHPSPKDTIKDIESKFDEPASVIEQGIRKGLFDGLKSKLLNKVKSDLSDNKPVIKLNESNTVMFNVNLAKYSPVGIKYEDLKNNKVVYLTESEILGYDRESKRFTALTESEISIPNGYKLLINAVNNCSYNPEKEMFGLNENWDFDLQLNKKGIVTVNGKEIPRNKIKNLLLESIQVYTNDPLKVKNFNKINYLKDADNFIMLVENSNKLIKFDNLESIKNLNENTYIIFDKENVHLNDPRILASNKFKNKLFESYNEMLEECKTILGSELNPLFENELINEAELISNRNKKIVDLSEEQSSINTAILKVKNLKSFAEQNSPAMDKLNEQEELLNNKLNSNLGELNFYKNEFKLY